MVNDDGWWLIDINGWLMVRNGADNDGLVDGLSAGW